MKYYRSVLYTALLSGWITILFLTGGCNGNTKKINIVRPEPEGIKVINNESINDKEKSSPNYKWIKGPTPNQEIKKFEGSDLKGKYLMNFDQVDLNQFIDSLMSNVFKLNYITTPSVRAKEEKITIKMTEELPLEKTFNLFEKVLQLQGIKLEKEENTYIFSLSKVKPFNIKGPIVYGRTIPDNFDYTDTDELTFLIPFYNVKPDILQPIIKNQLSSYTLTIPIKGLNVLYVNGKLKEIRYIITLVGLLDRLDFKSKHILMVTPKFWDISTFYEKIKVLLEAEGIDWKNVQVSRSIHFVPLENINSLLVISSVEEWSKRILYWLKELDKPQSAGKARNVYLYHVRNVEVDSAVKVLKEYQKNDKKQSSPATPAMKTNPKTPGAATISSTQKTVNGVSVIPIKDSNSIVLVANPVEYKKYLEILKKIDLPRNQIFVEVLIGEVSIDSSTQLGLEFWANKYLTKTEFGTKGGLGIYQPSNDGSNSIQSGANSFLKGMLPGLQYDILINALITESKIKIISSPKITLVENSEAEITVGSDIPVISSETGGGSYGGYTGNNTNNQTTTQTNQSYYYPYRSISYVNTGIILKVKGAILSDGKVSLDITQEISEAQENTKSDISSPEILKRTIKTNMIVQEGEIAFIGGLIQNKNSSSKSGVPVISKIPIIGSLFKNKSKRLRKTELVVFINAKIIKKSSQMNEIIQGIRNIITEYPFFEEEKTSNEKE